MNWLRLYCDSLENEKVQQLAPELYKAWANLLCIARRFDGVLPSLSKIAFQLHTTPETAGAWVTALIDRRLFDQTVEGVRPHDWEQYQYPSDSSAERVRKYRKKTALKQPETLLKRYSNGLEQRREEVTPIGAASKTDIEAARELIDQYPGARGLPGHPDTDIVLRCLALSGGSVDELGRGLRAMMVASKKPNLSWAWFPKVLESYLSRERSA